jgi:hypothetical protein
MEQAAQAAVEMAAYQAEAQQSRELQTQAVVLAAAIL